MSALDRRAVMAGGAILAAGLAASAAAQTPPPATASPAAPPPGFSPRPLPFDPKTITGLSERLLVSHHDNNYAGAVTRLNAIEGQLRQTDFAAAPGFVINGLKREELIALNSVILHEVYFSNIGHGGSRPAAALARQIETDFGSNDKWRAEFTGMGKALGGGSGWVLLTWSARAGRLVNTWASDHTQTAGDGVVLVALDMYEHAYQMDYGARAGDYVAAYMAALDWTTASAAFTAARRT
jgi:Fe-Mn family superoxide dismutase